MVDTLEETMRRKVILEQELEAERLQAEVDAMEKAKGKQKVGILTGMKNIKVKW